MADLAFPHSAAAADWATVAEVLSFASRLPVTDPEAAVVSLMVRTRDALRAEAGLIVVAMHEGQGTKRGAMPPVAEWLPVAFFDDPQRSELRAQIHDAFVGAREYIKDRTSEAIVAGAGKLRVHRYCELIPHDEWLVSPMALALALLGVRDRMVALLPLSPTLEICYGFDRAAQDSAFDERDKATLLSVLDGTRPTWERLARVLGVLGAREALTPREREVVRALLQGQSETEIAASVGMTARSAHQRIVAIYRKLGVRTRAELAAAVLDGAVPR